MAGGLNFVHTDTMLVANGLVGKRNARPGQAKGDEASQGKPGRSPARKDRDRLFYADSFHRLNGITQVLSPSLKVPALHNRLTHSMKVAQVARSIAEQLIRKSYDDTGLRKHILKHGGIDADVVEAAALAHDLGHPPFGHIAEAQLDAIARRGSSAIRADGFEGNAQTFRIITKTEPYKIIGDGLSLTRATRAAVLKYPWPRPNLHIDKPAEHDRKMRDEPQYAAKWKKFGYYSSEAADFQDARSWLPVEMRQGEHQSLEATIMDIADDITYAVHDIEDFYKGSLLDMLAIRGELKDYIDSPQSFSGQAFRHLERSLSKKYPGIFNAAFMRNVMEKIVIPNFSVRFQTRYDGTDRACQKVRQFASDAVDSLINAVEPADPQKTKVGAYLFLDNQAWHVVQLYKQIVRDFVIGRSDVALIQRSQAALIQELHDELVLWRAEADRADATHSLPARLRDENDYYGSNGPFGSIDRMPIDYLCTLTDAQVYQLHSVLKSLEAPEIVRASL